MPARLIESLATTEPLAEIFADDSVLQTMLDFEVALARAEARVGIVPKSAAETISSAAHASEFDIPALSRAMFRAGTAAIPLIKALTEKVQARDRNAAGWVHWGATSQDVADTALILLLKRAYPILDGDLERLEKSLVKLSEQHKATVMLGRTLMQPAPPTTFGLKAAGWLGALHRGTKRFKSAYDEALVLQFGGASGTLASLGDEGPAVARALAEELGLTCPEAPWHTHRDRLASLVCCCGIVTGSLGKMARDISLLMQTEVGEVAEPGGEGRGGSSTMPHKRNPTACSLTLSAAQRVPSLVASFLSAMVQEHERAVGSWQSEWPVVASTVQLTGMAAASMAEVAEGLTVHAERMQQNIEKTKGLIFAERAMMLLAQKLGRDVAHKLLEDATCQSIAQNKRLSAVLQELPEVASHIDRSALAQLEIPEQYLGSAEAFRQALVNCCTQKKREQ
ncbi:MAG TPA: 3-carboxy-cis,cis-muconate cycloisomerase [Terriglobales bacterium]|nr:3-carboxy-cis,cis-muconate cycloisomerase [Terriglobales bacterium]